LVTQVVAYGVGKSTVKEEFEAVVDDEEEGVTPDDEAIEDTTVDPMQVPLLYLELHPGQACCKLAVFQSQRNL